jgi:hypothetical protein
MHNNCAAVREAHLCIPVALGPLFLLLALGVEVFLLALLQFLGLLPQQRCWRLLLLLLLLGLWPSRRRRRMIVSLPANACNTTA